MQAVILIGGLGTRLRPLTYTIPKGLVEVAGRPFLEYELLYLKKFGVERVLFLTGYLGEQVEERFPDGSIPGLEFTYSREEKPRKNAPGRKEKGLSSSARPPPDSARETASASLREERFRFPNPRLPDSQEVPPPSRKERFSPAAGTPSS
jgi:hypothetical protein